MTDESAAGLAGFRRLAGVRPQIVMLYQTWSTPLFYRTQLRPIAATGAVPMITWDPSLGSAGVPLAAIAAGRYDRYLRGQARLARRWRRRLLIRFGHEMNLPSSPFGPGRDGNTRAGFVAAWRHVVRLFRGARASNVEWVWSPNVDCLGHCRFQPFYPGDRWVDWAGLDGYNYGALLQAPWRSFGRIFGPSYRALTRLSSRPVMIAETSSVPQGGSKARWISQIGPALGSRFRRVRALVWFQRLKESDWRIDSSPASLAAFRRLVTAPPFVGPPP